MPQAKDATFLAVDCAGTGATKPAPSEITAPLLRVLMGKRPDDRVPMLSRGIRIGLIFVAPFWAAVAVLLWRLL